MEDRERYKQEARKYSDELVRLITERDELNRRIAHLKMDLGALRQLAGLREQDRELTQSYKKLVRLTLTMAVEEALRSSDDPLTAAEVKDRMIQMGYDGRRHSNLLASVHTTLKRLSTRDSVSVKAATRGGKATYSLMR